MEHRPVKTTLFSVLLSWMLLFTMVAAPGRGLLAANQPRGSYIVQGKDATQVAALVTKFGGEVTSRLDIIDGVGALLSTRAVNRLMAHPVITRVTPNAQVLSSGTNPSTDFPEVVGADVAWAQGVTGAGVTVAVLDTGIAKQHQGLSKDIDNNDRIIGWVDFVENKNNPTDPSGHGSHIAGIIANSQKGEDDRWQGVAPGVNLVGVRVLDEAGMGTYEQAILGLQWVVANQALYNIRVVNLSLVAEVASPYWADPLNQAVMQAWANGIVVVAAAGNGGPGAMSIGVPGNNPYIITVGSFTDNYTPTDWSDDYVTPFSAAGPTLDGFVKPDVVAPGAHIVSSMMNSSYLAQNYQANRLNSHYFSMAGTSQAAAVTSGIAALVLSNNPALTPDQVKYRLMISAFPWVDPDTGDGLYSIWQQGAGRVNAPDAVFGTEEGSANAGMDILADLSGLQHYEGYSTYDSSTGKFVLRGSYGTWAGAYGTWAGAYGTWAGAYGTWAGAYGTWAGAYGTWAGAYGTWAGAYGTWAGAYGTWAGAYGTWAGAYGTWAGAYGTWAGAYGTWAGAYGTWAGAYGTWAGSYGDPAFAAAFVNWTDGTIASPWLQAQNMIGSWLGDQ